MSMNDERAAALQWLLGGDTGISSKTICAVMAGAETPKYCGDVPGDPDDFGRCYRLLKLIPTWRDRLQEVADRHKEWGPLVREWAELERMYEAEETRRQATPKTLYRRMQELIDEGRLEAGWTKIGPGCWQGSGRTVVEITGA